MFLQTVAKRCFMAGGVALALMLGSPSAWAQVPPRSNAPGKPPATTRSDKTPTTLIGMELLTGDPSAALHAHAWRATLEEMDVTLSTRKPILDDKPRVEQQMLGTLRKITIVATLTRDGSIKTDRKTFAQRDVAALKEWIDELRVYGAQGTPQGQPLWGLSELQFNPLYDALSQPLGVELKGKSLAEVIAAIPLKDRFPLRVSEQASLSLSKRPEEHRLVRQTTGRFTIGTALALALRDLELGYRPRRTPAGEIELVVDPLPEKLPTLVIDNADFWPVGWPVKLGPQKLAPGLYDIQAMQLDGMTLGEVLIKAQAEGKVPIHFDFAAIDRAGIDVVTPKVKYPSRKTSWSIAVRGCVSQAGMSRELLQDEGGHPFLWIYKNPSSID
ncbi:MAG: hypothetical protein C0478_00660 [Planctomyces sp.]|nr:hypothetical protein [Planctomyces sp.]